MSAHTVRLALRRLIEAPGLSLVPGVANPQFARIAADVGFRCVFATGAGIANSVYGLPDLGLVSLAEVVSVTRQIVQAVPSIPVIADGDTGHGNHLNVYRTIEEFERAGAAGITLEDQVAPKRCGHLEGKAVVPVAEMVEKIEAAADARSDPALVLIARTDAIATDGLDAALERGVAYAAAGADMIFVEAPRTFEDLERIPRAMSVPCVVNIVEGQKTPIISATELERMGFSLALYANLALRIAGAAVERAFEVLRETGSSESLVSEMWPWERRQALAGLPTWELRERRSARRRAARNCGCEPSGSSLAKP